MADTEAKMAAFEGLLNEVSSAMTDLVSTMEQDGKDTKAIGQLIAKAIGGIKFEPKVLVNNPITLNAPERILSDWRFEPEYDPATGLLKCLYAYRMQGTNT
jgi:hypothetical protein